jgi:hypothetical protein
MQISEHMRVQREKLSKRLMTSEKLEFCEMQTGGSHACRWTRITVVCGLVGHSR